LRYNQVTERNHLLLTISKKQLRKIEIWTPGSHFNPAYVNGESNNVSMLTNIKLIKRKSGFNYQKHILLDVIQERDQIEAL
jgi:hypothetical protein